ncbi:MAG: hypothetical protein H7Y59_13030 [Anaerolineales bacterium]|nr:hypothetical protein [Anaerolineales bacterium]
MKNLSQRDFIWILPLSLGLGAVLSSLQPGNWLIGWLGFSFLFLLCISLLTLSTRWAGASTSFNSTSTSFTPLSAKTLIWMVALAFALRFAGGVITYLALPVYGYVEDEEQSAGFTYTDAYRRDGQAWDLANSEQPVLDAFNQKFASDQYGGLLAFSAFIYRYVSPDAHRPLILVLMSAFMSALAVPFLFKAVGQQWGEKVAIVSGWIYALYPESILLGGSAMREPYLWLFSAFVLWGFVSWQNTHTRNSWIWVSLGITGMLLVSPSVALVTLIILVGWVYFTGERGRISWRMVAIAACVFMVGLFILSSAVDRQGNLGGGGPIGVITGFIRESLKLNVYKVEAESGWVQKLFDEMPEWMQLPFVMIYGILQPVLPAAIFSPTQVIWQIIGILRALGWYAILPVLIVSFVTATGSGLEKNRRLLIWLSFIVWGWILFTALRGGGDQWDNPRYRSILFLWQAILAGNVLVWWQETKNAWLLRVILMEVIFLILFGQWYANRYIHFGTQLPFAHMVVIILGLWALIFIWGLWRDRKRSV